MAHGLSCSAACGIFPDQGSNPCPLHWRILNHCATREVLFYIFKLIYLFIYFWLRWVFVAARGFSLVAENGVYSDAVPMLLIEVASLVAEHGF